MKMTTFRYRNFALPPNVLRLLEVLLSITAVALVTDWHKGDVTFYSLDQGDFNVVHNIQYFVGISILTILSVAIMCVIVLVKPIRLSPLIDLVLNAILCLLYLIAAFVMCGSLSHLGKSSAVKEARLTFCNLEAALALGFTIAFALGGNAWFAFQVHRHGSEMPLNQSHGNANLPGDIPT